MPVLYGIKACDTCRKAVKAMEAAGRDVTFRDVREMPLSASEIRSFLDAFGEALINRRSTTWRTLSEEARAGDAASLLAEHPTLMKRPVIEDGAVLTLGWDAAARTAHLG